MGPKNTTPATPDVVVYSQTTTQNLTIPTIPSVTTLNAALASSAGWPKDSYTKSQLLSYDWLVNQLGLHLSYNGKSDPCYLILNTDISSLPTTVSNLIENYPEKNSDPDCGTVFSKEAQIVAWAVDFDTYIKDLKSFLTSVFLSEDIITNKVMANIASGTPTPNPSTTSFWINLAATVIAVAAEICSAGVATAAVASGLAAFATGVGFASSAVSQFGGQEAFSTVSPGDFYSMINASYLSVQGSIELQSTEVLSNYGKLQSIGTSIDKSLIPTDFTQATILASQAYEVFLWQQVMQHQFAIWSVPSSTVASISGLTKFYYNDPFWSSTSLYASGEKWIGFSTTAATNNNPGDVNEQLQNYLFKTFGVKVSDMIAGKNGWLFTSQTYTAETDGGGRAELVHTPKVITGSWWG